MRLTFTIKATVDGMAGELAIEADKLEQIRAVLREMPKHGIQPAASFEFPRTPDGKPICPKHGVEMRLREKQGDAWHSHSVVDARTGERMFCRGYASPSSPGYDVPAEQAGIDEDHEAEDDLWAATHGGQARSRTNGASAPSRSAPPSRFGRH